MLEDVIINLNSIFLSRLTDSLHKKTKIDAFDYLDYRQDIQMNAYLKDYLEDVEK